MCEKNLAMELEVVANQDRGKKERREMDVVEISRDRPGPIPLVFLFLSREIVR